MTPGPHEQDMILAFLLGTGFGVVLSIVVAIIAVEAARRSR